MDSNSIAELEKMIKTTEDKIKKQIQKYQGIPKIILLGNTGAGKSCLTDSLTNNKLKIAYGAGKKVVLQSENEQNNDQIKGIIYNEQENLLFCDCPGFDEDNEFDEDVIDSIAIDSIIQNYSQQDDKLKILLVLSAWEFESKRGKEIVKMLDKIQRMFPNQEKLQDGMGIIITKGEIETSGIDYINRLKERSSQELKDACDYFLKRPDMIFTFPQASEEKIGKYYEFEDKEKLLSFIKNNYIINPEHNVALGESSLKLIKKTTSQNSHKIDITVSCIFEEIAKKYQNENDIKDFKKWINIMKILKDSNICNSNDFKSCLNNNFPPIPKSELYFKQIEFYESINNSIFSILKCENTNSYFKKIIEFHSNKSIQEIENIVKQFQQINDKQKIIDEKEQLKKQLGLKQIEDEEEIAKYQKKLENDKIIEAKQQELIKTLELEKQKRLREEQKCLSQEQEKTKSLKPMPNCNYENYDLYQLCDQPSVNKHKNEMITANDDLIMDKQTLIEDRIKFENEKQQWEIQKRYYEQQLYNERRKIKQMQQNEQMRRWNEDSHLYRREEKSRCTIY